MERVGVSIACPRWVIAALFLGAVLVSPALTAAQVSLPRKTGGGPDRDESYPGVTVLYDAIRDAAGHRLRVIATYPGDRAQRAARYVRRNSSSYRTRGIRSNTTPLYRMPGICGRLPVDVSSSGAFGPQQSPQVSSCTQQPVLPVSPR
jgi:hypothetical protein